MTQWSREYLYTGEEKEEKHRPETCVHCSHFKRPEPNSFNWHLRIGTCLLKHRDKGFEKRINEILAEVGTVGNKEYELYCAIVQDEFNIRLKGI